MKRSATDCCYTLEVASGDCILLGSDGPAALESTMVRSIANLAHLNGSSAEALRRVERGNVLGVFPRLADVEDGRAGTR